MRKWLAGVLAAVMCFAGGAALAKCAHENTITEQYYTNDTYEQRDTYTHWHYEELYEKVTCQDCNQVLSDEYGGGRRGETDQHTWNTGGVCELCYQVNTCVHENTWTRSEWNNQAYTQIADDWYHQYSYDVYEEVECSDCHVIISYTCIETVVKNDRHFWDENGICEFCDQMNTCLHDETQKGTHTGNYERIPIGDLGSHQVEYDRYDIVWCTNCGTWMTKTYVEHVSELQQHTWQEDGTCWCGQKNECPHETAESSEYESYALRYSQIGHPKYHQRIAGVYEQIHCKDCHLKLSETLVRTVTYDDSTHYWNDDGICVYCGQENECLHEETTNRYAYSNYHYDQIGDAKYHQVTYDMSTDQRCVNCDLITSYGEKNTYTYNDTHSWNEEGICGYCEQVNDCMHEELETNRHETSWQYENTNDPYTHKKITTYYNTEDCVNCAKQFSQTELLTEEKTENHSWNGGACWNCEYVCQHGETTSSEYYLDYRDEQIGDLLNHKYAWDVYMITDCSICYQRLSDEFSHTDGVLYQHNWNDAGFCNDCNQENTCAHANVNVWISNENWRYEQIGSDTEHLEFFESYEITNCLDCGMYKREDAGNTSRVDRHWWNDEGFCSECGQENTCPHEDRRSETWGRNHQWTQIGSSLEHQLTYDKYEVEICNICDMVVLESYLDTIVENEEHRWNDENKCWNCGQENACQHDGETQSRTENENYRYESTGDPRWHQYAYDVYRVVECAGCGVELSRTFESTDGWNSSHSWRDDSVCSDCGQKNTCAHEDVTENTYPSDDVYTEVDEETHLHAFAMNIRKRCQICYLELEERIGGRYEAEEKHVWNDEGICWECGAENACAHANTREQEDIKRRTRTDLGDGLHHSVVEEVRHYTYCDDCQRRVSDYSEETREYTEEHTGKYRCWKCDFETECPHEGETDQAVDWIDLSYVPLDENRHEVYGRTETHIYCRDCDEELSVTQSEEQELLETWSHSWDDENVCKNCGYENLNPCTHENTDVKLQQTYGSGWIAQNDAMHAETVIYKEVSICADCGKTLGEVSALKKVTKTEAHDFEDGKCWECGYSNPCAHDGTTHTVTEVWDWWEVVCIDDETHQFDGTGAVITYCDLCGDIVSEEKLERQWITKEHEMWIDRCEYCDYRIDCAHENTVRKLLPDSDYLYCESISDNAHAATYILHAYDYCEDCDMLLEFENESSEVGMTKVNEPHEMVNYRCIECGYCEHPAEHMEMTSESRGSREFVIINDYLHESYITRDGKLVCGLCDETVKEWSEKHKRNIEEHYYDEQGICRGCGYVNECLHENAYRMQIVARGLQYEDIGDEKQHQLSEWMATEMFCPDCLMSWDRQTEEEPVVSMEDHRFRVVNGVNICRWCDYVSDRLPESCQHEHTEKWTYYGEQLSGYECIDEDYHAVYGTDLYEAIDCHDCHYTISETLVQEGRVLREANEAHIFDRNGVCRCGYVNPCKHKNTVIETAGDSKRYALQLDDTHHERVSIIEKQIYCADCGIWLSDVEPMEERSSYEEHSFDEFGVCSVCNYVNQCKHKQTQVNYDYVLNSCYAIDDVQHRIIQTIQKREECLACGEVIETEVVEEVSEEQEHDGESACSICGWKTPEHVHVWELPDEQVYAATTVDALTHEIVTQITGWYRCSECRYEEGQRIVLPAETVVEAHNFTDLGRCADCGYVNFCAHEETYEVQKPVFEPTYQMKDELEHTYTASMRIETRCAICDQRLSYTAALNEECTEEHVFDSVADLICDLCGYEKEAPEEAPTPEPTPEVTPEPEETPEPDETEEPDVTPKPTKKPGSGGSGSAEKPGFYVTVKSDKKHYAPDETAKLTITLRNTTGKCVENVRIEHLLPEGLQYAPDQDMSVFEPFVVEANTTVKRVVYVKVMGAGLPKTGDDSNLMLWLAVAAVSIAAVGFLSARRRRG